MSGTRLSDADLGRLLRAHLPSEASPALREVIRTSVEATPQQRSWPGPIGALLDADPRARRRTLLLAAMLLLALSAAVVGVVGALLERLERNPVVDLAMEPPADLPDFVRSAYTAMTVLQPMTISTLEDGQTRGRIYVDATGAIRVERYASPDATEPESYRIYAYTSIGELLVVDGQPAWRQQSGAITEDPRVFVYATLGAASFGTGSEHGCEVATSPGEVYAYTPGEAWEYVGLETIAGRPAHHVACDGVGDMWIDVETHLTMRSEGPRRGPDGREIPGPRHVIEVTAIELGQPPADLFKIERPDGVRTISDAEHQQHECIAYGWCLESPRPIDMPPPAPDRTPSLPADELLRLADDAPTTHGPYAITIEQLTTGLSDQGSRIVVYFNGSNRFRVETTSQIGTVWEETSVTLVGEGYRYTSETLIDGTPIWRSRPPKPTEPPFSSAYPILADLYCDALEHRGVDLVAGRAADRIGCSGDDATLAWIDHETQLVLRSHVFLDPVLGVTVSAVTAINLGPVVGIEWDLPADADVRS